MSIHGDHVNEDHEEGLCDYEGLCDQNKGLCDQGVHDQMSQWHVGLCDHEGLCDQEMKVCVTNGRPRSKKNSRAKINFVRSV